MKKRHCNRARAARAHRSVAAAAFLFAAALCGADEIAPLRENLVEHYTANPPRAAAVRTLMTSLRPDGTWPDVDYKNRQRSSWRAARHVYRVRDMAEAWAAKGHALAGGAGLREAVVRALGHWLEKDYKNPNWWWNRIGVPRQVDRILILMGDAVPKKQFDKAVNGILARAGIGMTGQNKVWVAGITLNRGVLLGDAAMVRAARDAIVSEVRVTTKEGIQPDFSFHQHGPQQQFGNYGLSFIREQLAWEEIFAGTAFALDGKRKTILRRYLLDGLAWVTWRGVLDISSCGRQIGPGSPAAKGRAVAGALKMIGQADRAPVGCRYFWRSAMGVCRRRDFCVTVKMSSKRVIGTETCNAENLQGYYLGDGATYIYHDNGEYRDIFPAWNWRRLPGVTAPRGSRRLVPNRRTQNRETFVGGAADGGDGVAAMVYRRDGLGARKAWFFCGPYVACLGAGITYQGSERVMTGVAQRLLEGAVRVAVGGPPRTVRGETRLEGSGWLHHDTTGYVFPVEADLALFAGTRTGTWRSIAAKYADRTVSRDVFELCVDHGTAPRDASYAWIAIPHVPRAAMASLAANLPRIVSNTPACQAVAAETLLAAVFYEKGRLDAGGWRVAVDAPCILMLRGSRLSIADPAQRAGNITVTVDGREKRTISLPGGGMAGSTVSVDLP